MLKTLALTTLIAALSGGTALGQTVRAPLPDQPTAAWLVKHDKEDNGDNGRGRKLGHYKHRGNDDDSTDDNGARATTTRRSNRDGTTTTTTTTTRRSQTNQAPYYYGAPPGYGNSYPTPYYGYQPPYYRGY